MRRLRQGAGLVKGSSIGPARRRESGFVGLLSLDQASAVGIGLDVKIFKTEGEAKSLCVPVGYGSSLVFSGCGAAGCAGSGTGKRRRR